MSIYAPPSNIQSVFNPSNYGGLGVDGQITTDYLDANYVQFPVVQGNMTLVGTSILGDVTQQGDLTTTGDITGETIEGTSFLVGTTNLLTEIGTKQDTIQDGDLTIAKTDGLQTALENKYDNTGGLISGGVQITGQLAPNGNIFTDERLVIQSGNTMEIQDETEVKISSGVVDIVVDGSDESINLNGYTFLNGSLELAEDESIFLNEVGGGNSKVLNYFNYNKLTDDVEGKQNTIDDGDLTIAKTDGLQTALDNKYDDTGGTIDGDVTISGDLVIGTTNVITEIGTKQDTINDGDLTIAKTDGLQTALNNKYDDTGGTIGGDVTINGDLVVGTTNIITEIGTKQDTIQDNGLTIAKTDGLQTALDNKYDDTGGTIDGDVDISGILMVEDVNVKDTLTSVRTQVDALINFTGGGVNFRAYNLSNATQSSGQNLNYDDIDYDTEDSYDTSDNIYTIVIGGTYVFSFGWSSITDSTAVINLIRNRGGVETILQQSTNGENTTNLNAFFLTTIAECETDDEIYAYLDSGTCRLVPYSTAAPDTLTSFSGSRISN